MQSTPPGNQQQHQRSGGGPAAGQAGNASKVAEKGKSQPRRSKRRASASGVGKLVQGQLTSFVQENVPHFYKCREVVEAEKQRDAKKCGKEKIADQDKESAEMYARPKQDWVLKDD